MNGPEGAAGRLADWLGQTVGDADWMAAFRTRNDLDADTIGPAAAVLPHDPGPAPLELFPFVYVVMGDLVSMALADVRDDASQIHRATYAATVYVMVRGDDYVTSDLLRKRFVLAVRESLLSRTQLAAADAEELGDEVAVLRTSLRENYSPPMVDVRFGGTLAGARTAVQIVVAEIIPGPEVYGTVETVDLTVQADTDGIPPVWTP